MFSTESYAHVDGMKRSKGASELLGEVSLEVLGDLLKVEFGAEEAPGAVVPASEVVLGELPTPRSRQSLPTGSPEAI